MTADGEAARQADRDPKAGLPPFATAPDASESTTASSSPPQAPSTAAPPPIATRGTFPGDVIRCLRFYSRIRVPRLPGEADPHARPDFTRIPRALPLAALAIVAPGALVLWGALSLGLSPLVSSCLAVMTVTMISGAFHEDGLADVADGFWGGATPERRLEIMKDSRVGSFGAAALGLALILRVIALGDLVAMLSPGAGAAALLAAGSISRTAGLIPLTFLPPARPDGFSASVGRPTLGTFMIAAALAAALAIAIALLSGLPLLGLLVGAGLAVAVGLALSTLSQSLIEGQTGDVAGATQQLAEIGVLMGLILGARAMAA